MVDMNSWSLIVEWNIVCDVLEIDGGDGLRRKIAIDVDGVRINREMWRYSNNWASLINVHF